MDEVGLIVRGIEADGFLRIEKLGGTDVRVLLGQRVWVRGSQGRLLGVIGTRSVHLLRDVDRTSVPTHADLYLDIGARTAARSRRMGVRQGDPAASSASWPSWGWVAGGSPRTPSTIAPAARSCLRCSRASSTKPPPVTLVALFTVQEEVGLRGAQAASRGEPYDLALAVDTTAVDDTPEIGTVPPAAGRRAGDQDHGLQPSGPPCRAARAACRGGGRRRWRCSTRS